MSPLEERLVALRQAFMQIRLLGSERQSMLRGNVVNVENDLDICAEVLPRKFDQTSTVQVQLMRRMKYRSPYMYETIRPFKVHNAAKYLMSSELYISQNVAFSEDWRLFNEGNLYTLRASLYMKVKRKSSCKVFFKLSVDDTIDFICGDGNNQESRNETHTNIEESDGKTITGQLKYSGNNILKFT
jgi:hypothetical protein